jgi:hypothetical protein
MAASTFELAPLISIASDVAFVPRPVSKDLRLKTVPPTWRFTAILPNNSVSEA